MKKIQTPLFYLFIIAINILFFWRSFNISLFKDDFFFFEISRINNVGAFLNFFSPIRTYSFKPLASEVFYFLINRNIFLGHLIVFITYFVGLLYLYKSIIFISKNKYFAQLSILIYSLSSAHVFQLYWLATYQEILVFTALSASFYFFLQRKTLISSIFYVCALLSKETAILYIIFLLFIELLTLSKARRLNMKSILFIFRRLIIYGLLSALFFCIYQYSLHYVTALDNYKMDLNFRRILNNSMWYFLWSWGVPSFLPDYMTSIFSAPINEFWKLWREPYVQLYFYLFGIYIFSFLSVFIAYIVTNRHITKKFFVLSLGAIACFFIYLGPVLFFPHRWMVRLTLPLIFISLLQSYILICYFESKRVFRYLAGILIVIYLAMSMAGTKLHENASTYTLESSITKRAEAVFKDINRFNNCSTIYIKDPKMMKMSSWDGSEKIALTFFGNSARSYFFPRRKDLNLVYEFQTRTQPIGSCVVGADEFLR